MSKSESIFHLISNTHWDREWRFPFQRNRQLLVDMIDAVIDILEKEPEYRAFHLDSQSIVLRDYLEIKPHNRSRIIKLTKENRLLHGPWYILPEEFQVGGENLIRNLLLGHQVSTEMGGVSKIGYSPFSWGQISQLPQIYNQFRINLIMFYRGINSIDSPKAEFLWEGADGTKMVASRFSTMPRYNFYFYIYRPSVHNEGFYDLEYAWGKKGTPFHFADYKQYTEDYFIISPQNGFFPQHIVPQVNKIIEDQANDFTTRHKIWMEGHDSSGPSAQTVNIIREIRKQMPHINVVHSTLEEYASAIANEVEVDNLKHVVGERRSAQNDNRCGNLFGYTTSARMYLKQANFNAERWIQYYAEPFNAFSGWLGRDINDKYPEAAWELIVQNSAHDSIGGCSLDRIHEDMMLRYKHSVEISKGIFERSLKFMLASLNTSAFQAGDDGIFLSLVNPTNYLRKDLVEAYIDIPTKVALNHIKLLDEAGNELQVQLLSRKAHQPVLEQMDNRPMYFDMNRYHCLIETPEVASFGIQTLLVKPISGNDNALPIDNGLVLENEYLKVSINDDGSLNILDKNLMVEYQNQAYVHDEGEAGHAWIHRPVAPFVTTLNMTAKIKKTISGPLYNEFEVYHTMLIPANLASRQSDKLDYVKNDLVLKIGLAKESKHIKIDVLFNNCSESHRLRLMFPTRLNITHSHGEGQFDVPARGIERPDTNNWLEQPMYDFPMHHFVDNSDGTRGLAVLVDGLKEYEVINDDDKTLAITLLRTFEYKINPSSPQDYSFEKGSQMLGKSHFKLALYPHAGDWKTGKVFREAFLFNYDLSLIQTGNLKGSNTTNRSFLKIEPEELIFSCLKKAEDGSGAFVLRIYNPTNHEIAGSVVVGVGLQKVELVSLEELKLESIDPLNENTFNVVLQPGKIKSYKLFV